MAWRRVIGVLLCGVAGCAVQRPPARPPAWAPQPFIITFWCGPPLAEFTDARAEQIVAAGFSVVGPPCEGGRDRADQLRALDVADRHGLRMWIIDNRIAKTAVHDSGWQAGAAAMVADYGGQPALDGYFVTDEPSAGEFGAVAQLVAWLRAADPRRLAYVNLYPGFVTAPALGTERYEDYIEQFVTVVHPQLLSYDYYPFLKERDRRGFFANLALVREAATRHDLPFLYIAQAMPHWQYRDPSEAELAWQILHALAFGARGISYFAYWTPVDVEGADVMNFHHGLIEAGRPTRHYFEAARVNRTVRALADQLAGFRSLAVADSLGEIGVPFPIGPIDGIEGGPVTAGLFTSGGDLAVLLVNRDYRDGINAAIRLRAGASFPEIFDPVGGRWQATDSLVMPLGPGDALLLRWRQPS